MLLSCHFDGGMSSKVKYCFISDFRNSVGVSWVLVEVTTSTMDCDSYKKEWGNDRGSNETPTKGVDGYLHGSSIREPRPLRDTRSSSSSFRQSSASKIDQLYEISYVPDDSEIPVEHLVSLSLPSNLPRHCLAQGYTHIHVGAIRLALTFHGRKGLPAYSRIALLDRSYLVEAAKINDDEDLPRKRKSLQQKLKKRYEKGDPTVGLLGEPLGKFDYYVLYPKAEPSQPPSPHKPPPTITSPPPLKLSPCNQKGLIHPPSRLTNKRQRKNVESTVQFDAEEYEEHQENPNQETPTEFPKSDIKQYFTFDDALNQVEPVDVSDLESFYSLDDEPSDSILCTIAYSDLSSDDDSDTDLLKSDSDFGIHMVNPIPHVLPIQEDPPLPLAKIHFLTDAYTKPILGIAFFDTGSSMSILNPNILPDHYWKPHHKNFMAANGEKFIIDKISVHINIRLFPKYVIKRRLLGSSSHGKDLLIGFDIA
nr:reverse transcriptase domain, viral movement protein [Tanacetum cinerariifolium]